VSFDQALAGGWDQAATVARRLAWVSLIWMSLEAVLGLIVGLRAGAISLVGWAAGSAVEGLAAAVIIWRFSHDRRRSDGVERHAQQLVALSFWVLAPYIAVEAARHLLRHERPAATSIGVVLTAVAVVGMPVMGRAKHRLADRLGSAATAGEGSQNYLCALQAAAVLLTLAVTAISPSVWWFDPVVALGLAGWAIREGRRAGRATTAADDPRRRSRHAVHAASPGNCTSHKRPSRRPLSQGRPGLSSECAELRCPRGAPTTWERRQVRVHVTRCGPPSGGRCWCCSSEPMTQGGW
jgi:hypothetical protein